MEQVSFPQVVSQMQMQSVDPPLRLAIKQLMQDHNKGGKAKIVREFRVSTKCREEGCKSDGEQFWMVDFKAPFKGAQ